MKGSGGMEGSEGMEGTRPRVKNLGESEEGCLQYDSPDFLNICKLPDFYPSD